MKIAMAGDHAGFNLKKEIKELLESQGHEVIDFGPFNEESCDLPDFIYPASLAVSKLEVDRGIFIDGVGYGSALIANKIYGVYAAVCQDPFCASLALLTQIQTYFVLVEKLLVLLSHKKL